MSQPQDEALTRWLTAALAEYQSLRTESLQAQQAQQTILQFGITGVAVLLGLSLQLENKVLAILLLLFLVPLLSIFIVTVWFTELFRSLRAGDYIAGLEAKINSIAGQQPPALDWETWLRRNPQLRMFSRDHMSFAVLCTLNIAGFVLAGYLANGANLDVDRPTLVVAALGFVSLILLATIIGLYLRYAKRIHKRDAAQP
jgi:hypothetical protein